MTGPPDMGEVVLWTIDLDRTAPDASILTAQERARGDAFRFDSDRRRFLAGRTARRVILAGAMGRAPADLVFLEGGGAKPRLSKASADLDFSFSRSGGRALLAVSIGCAIGVDVEAIAETGDLELVVDAHFAPVERHHLNSLSGPDRLEAFYRLWTAKEAAVKATGEGIVGDLKKVAFTIGDQMSIADEPSRLLKLVPLADARTSRPAGEAVSLRMDWSGPVAACVLTARAIKTISLRALQ
ncbi:MAG: 4'-phosphopantetheinyl transferase superfamily protein [Pseudomonadota bacterium]